MVTAGGKEYSPIPLSGEIMKYNLIKLRSNKNPVADAVMNFRAETEL